MGQAAPGTKPTSHMYWTEPYKS